MRQERSNEAFQIDPRPADRLVGASPDGPALHTGHQPLRRPGARPAPDDYWTKPELLADCVLARQRAVRFWGEAMPFLYMDYGAPAMALQMGAKASWTSIETLWADPCVETADEVAALRPGGYWKEIQDRRHP